MAKRTAASIITIIFVFLLNYFLIYTRVENPYIQNGQPLSLDLFTRYLRFVFLEGFGPYERNPQITTLQYIISQTPLSFLLLSVSAFLAIAIGISLGLLVAYHRGGHGVRGRLNTLISIAALIPLIIPTWYLAYTFQHSLSPWFPLAHWFSAQWMMNSPLTNVPGFLTDVAWHMTLPMLSLTLSILGIFFIVARNSLTDIFNEEYFLTAQAKGLSDTKIVFKHVIKNAMLPILAIISLVPVLILNSTLAVEHVYSLQGIGRILYSSMVRTSGFVVFRIEPSALLQASFLMIGVLMVIGQLIIDVTYRVLDPRIQKQEVRTERSPHTASRFKRLRYIYGLLLALIILSTIIFFQLDLFINTRLYEYGLQFDYAWANNYWLLARSLLILQGAAAAAIAFLLIKQLTISKNYLAHVFAGTKNLGSKLHPRNLKERLFGKRMRRKVKHFLSIFWHGSSGKFGIIVLGFFAFMGVFAPILTVDPLIGLPIMNTLSTGSVTGSKPPTLHNPLGTDYSGVDVVSRVVWASRFSLIELIAAIVIALGIGCVVGLMSGYYDGRWSAYVLDRITDVFLSVPLIVFVLFFPLEIPMAGLRWVPAIGLATWGITAKLVRSKVITAKEKLHVEAARAIGASNNYIMWNHVFPEALSAAASSVIYTAIMILFMQSTLDFLGFRRMTWSTIDVRTAPLDITFGALIAYQAIYGSGAWWALLVPAICIILIGSALISLGYKTAEAMNPRVQREIEVKRFIRRSRLSKTHKRAIGVFFASTFLFSIFIVPRIAPIEVVQNVKVRIDYDGGWKGYIFDAENMFEFLTVGSVERLLNRRGQLEWEICVVAKILETTMTCLNVTISTTDGRMLMKVSNDSYGIAVATWSDRSG